MSVEDLNMNLLKIAGLLMLGMLVGAGCKYVAGDDQLFTSVKSEVKTLLCDLGEGEVTVAADKVVAYYPDQGYWKFTNGGSSSCRVTE